MTIKEAIKDLLLLRDVVIKNKDSKEALSLAISALEENEKLKAEMEMCIKLPCKIGDTIYTRKIEKLYVTGIYIADDICIKTASDKSNSIWTGREFGVEDFGKLVFITREEAEKALQGTNHEN